MITQETIDQIFSTARVEEVIGDFVQMKKSGSNFKALSPFVDEKTPSFMISPAKQIWKDFSSGKGGNAVSFLMELEQFSYPEALRYLAKKYNIEIKEDKTYNTEEQQAEKKQRELLYQIQEIAKDFFSDYLWNNDEGKSIGLSYFKERGFTDETIKTFQLGFSPVQKDAFTTFIFEKGYKKELIEQSGLSFFRDNYSADRFRERVMFPIFSYSGRTIGFGGRILKSTDKTAKYINSPETEIYHKSKILFGLFQAKKEIVKKDVCFLVEGYTDVISLYQKGIQNVVASSGTALTQEQIKLIKRLTQNVTLLFDGDSAGIKASLRGIDMILKEGMNVKVLLFPEGEDPDSFAKKNSEEELNTFINKNAKDFIQFKTQLLLKDSNNDPVLRAGVVKDIVSSIACIPNAIQREIYVQNTSHLLEISEKALFKDLQQKLSTEQRNSHKKAKQEQSSHLKVAAKNEVEINPIFEAENKLIELMLKFGNTILSMEHEEETIESTVIEEILHQLEVDHLELKTEFLQKIYNDIREGYSNDEMRTGDFFLTYTDSEISSFTVDKLFDKHSISPNWEKQNIFVKTIESDVKKEVEQTIMNYKLLNIVQMIQELANKETETEEEREEKLKKTIQLNQVRSQISLLLHRPN